MAEAAVRLCRGVAGELGHLASLGGFGLGWVETGGLDGIVG